MKKFNIQGNTEHNDHYDIYNLETAGKIATLSAKDMLLLGKTIQKYVWKKEVNSHFDLYRKYMFEEFNVQINPTKEKVMMKLLEEWSGNNPDVAIEILEHLRMNGHRQFFNYHKPIVLGGCRL
ncbi:MAG: hypothetical protein LBS20_21555 [Prevotella sp.]|nr:hypothetical protein [Prevotella sp.]